MLTGTRAFEGDDITITLASVLKDEVRWDALPADVPSQIRRLLRRCLEKDPKRRLSAIGDARLELDDADSGVDEAAAASVPAPLKPAAWRRAMPAVIAALAVGSAGAFAWWLKPVHQAQPVIRVTDILPTGQLPTGRNGLWLAMSADGSTLVYGANQQLFIRTTNALAATALAGTEGATAPFFSFDGQWIGFSAGGKLKKVSVRGGSITTICDTPASSASWGTDNQILLAGVSGRGVFRVPASGGKPEVLIPPSPNVSAHYPQMLRGGRDFLYVRWSRFSVDVSELVLRSLASGEETILLRGAAYNFRYLPSGHLVYAEAGALKVVAFDPSSRRVSGAPATVIQGVERTQAGDGYQFALSDNGTLAYLPTSSAGAAAARLMAVDRAGHAAPLPTEGRDYSDPRVSPDGRSVAVHVQDGHDDVWVAGVERGVLTRLSFDPGEDETPVWSPDSRTIAWAATRANRRGIYKRASDGSGDEQQAWMLDKHTHVREWLPDGRSLLLEIQDIQTETDIWRLDLSGQPTATPVLRTPFNERNSRVSPDGRWLAYVSDASGRGEIYIRSFPSGDAMIPVTSGGGDQPVWGRDGRTLLLSRGRRHPGGVLRGGCQSVAREAARAVSRFVRESPSGRAYRLRRVF